MRFIDHWERNSLYITSKEQREMALMLKATDYNSSRYGMYMTNTELQNLGSRQRKAYNYTGNLWCTRANYFIHSFSIQGIVSYNYAISIMSISQFQFLIYNHIT
jgi:hypothetical protein